MSIKSFVLRYGATCPNWNFAWSYINDAQKFVILTAWQHEFDGERYKVFSANWRLNQSGRKNNGYRITKGHIEQALFEGYSVKIVRKYARLPIQGVVQTERFDEELVPAKITAENGEVFAYPNYVGEVLQISEEASDRGTIYMEGARYQVLQNGYERNPEARKACLEEYGFSCSVCGFNFLRQYGDIGTNYIHVHHLNPISQKGGVYAVNPLDDLRPVCANCHAMIHKKKEPYTIEEMKKHIAKAASVSVKK